MELMVTLLGDRPIEREEEIFVIRTDQMTISGGQDSGPTPLNLTLAGLGMCSGMELLAFCRTRDLPVDEVALRISPRLNVEARCVEEIHVEVLLPSSFPEQYEEPCFRAVSQ